MDECADSCGSSGDGVGEVSGGYGCAPASHIEITAYGLLALVAGGRTGSAFPVARWLMQQRNQFGGFASTQVSAVCLLCCNCHCSSH